MTTRATTAKPNTVCDPETLARMTAAMNRKYIVDNTVAIAEIHDDATYAHDAKSANTNAAGKGNAHRFACRRADAEKCLGAGHKSHHGRISDRSVRFRKSQRICEGRWLSQQRRQERLSCGKHVRGFRDATGGLDVRQPRRRRAADDDVACSALLRDGLGKL